MLESKADRIDPHLLLLPPLELSEHLVLRPLIPEMLGTLISLDNKEHFLFWWGTSHRFHLAHTVVA